LIYDSDGAVQQRSAPEALAHSPPASPALINKPNHKRHKESL